DAPAPPPKIAAPDESFHVELPPGTNLRTPVQPKAFDLKALPVGDVPEPLPPASAPSQLPAGDAPTELTFDRSGAVKGAQGPMVRVAVNYRSIGRIRIGFSEGTLGDPSSTGVYVNCGGRDTSTRHALPARWETIRASTPGHAAYSVTNAWF